MSKWAEILWGFRKNQIKHLLKISPAYLKNWCIMVHSCYKVWLTLYPWVRNSKTHLCLLLISDSIDRWIYLVDYDEPNQLFIDESPNKKLLFFVSKHIQIWYLIWNACDRLWLDHYLNYNLIDAWDRETKIICLRLPAAPQSKNELER